VWNYQLEDTIYQLKIQLKGTYDLDKKNELKEKKLTELLQIQEEYHLQNKIKYETGNILKVTEEIPFNIETESFLGPDRILLKIKVDGKIGVGQKLKVIENHKKNGMIHVQEVGNEERKFYSSVKFLQDHTEKLIKERLKKGLKKEDQIMPPKKEGVEDEGIDDGEEIEHKEKIEHKEEIKEEERNHNQEEGDRNETSNYEHSLNVSPEEIEFNLYENKEVVYEVDTNEYPKNATNSKKDGLIYKNLSKLKNKIDVEEENSNN